MRKQQINNIKKLIFERCGSMTNYALQVNMIGFSKITKMKKNQSKPKECSLITYDY